MTKNEFLDVFFIHELERLERVDHLTQKGEEGRYNEIDKVLGKLNYLWLNEYMQSKERETLKISDIPKDYLVTCLIYLSHSAYSDMEFFEDYEKLAEVLIGLGLFGQQIAKRLEDIYINFEKSFEKFMVPNEKVKEDAID